MKDTCILITNGCSNANVFQLLTDKKQRHINRTQGAQPNQGIQEAKTTCLRTAHWTFLSSQEKAQLLELGT